MNKIRFSFFIAAAALLLTAGGLRAQTSIQRLTFTLLAQYQKNIFYTNTANPGGPLTNEFSVIRTVLITAGNVVKALAVDVGGTNWTNWAGSALVREVNLIDGTEGIFLRKGGDQTNVSSFFGGSFSNNFTAELTNAFPGATNNFQGLTNNIIDNETNNSAPQLQLDRGWRIMPENDPTNITTNFDITAGVYYISVNTTNLKFSLVAVGDGSVTNVAGNIDGTLYQRVINYQFLGSAGTFYLNLTTNVFDSGTNPPEFYTGPLRGTFGTTAPWFSTIPGP
jgi:hypothetical protein